MLHTTHEGRDDVRLPRRLLAAMVLVSFFALSVSSYVALTRSLQYQGRDEGPNAAYAIELSQGRLPTINTPVTTDAARHPLVVAGRTRMSDESHRHIWTANHPPLYYALSVPLVYAADQLDAPQLLIVGMRLINAVGSGLCVLLVGLIAFELTRRPEVALLATGISASCAVLVSAGGHIANDGVAVAASSLALLGTLRILGRGLTGRRLALVAVAGVAAAGAKAPGVLTVALCGAALAVALLVQDRSRRGVLRAVGAAAVATGLPALATGWFYVRNIVLYGDPTASGALLEKFAREPNGTWWQVLSDAQMWADWLRRLWTPVLGEWYVVFVDLLAVVAALGLLALLARRVVGGPRGPAGSGRGWLLLTVHALVVVVNLIGFVAGGGNPNDRYLMPLMPVLASALALGVVAILDLVPVGPQRLRARWATAALTLGLVVYGTLLFKRFADSPMYRGLLPDAHTTLAASVLAAGLAGAVVAVVLAVVLAAWPPAEARTTYAAPRPPRGRPAPHRR
ncbi:phospholipid carrier-dependent glycosyltransferase [Nocardioides albertanoniae]|uniref:phospholipid carrier-dependent glycosyltransferase n=1 Tax=Nocardioides albertanoniae TaxID=1175486 RepID=UPI0014769182|nr:phospholipid carrier-dependent glycosyltransferase [Nocardioides albertanoniae]